MQVTNQKRMAAQLLTKQEGKEVGLNRVWIHPAYIDQVATAVQKEEIREMIEEGIIRSKPVKGTSRVRARIANNQKLKGRRKSNTKLWVSLIKRRAYKDYINNDFK